MKKMLHECASLKYRLYHTYLDLGILALFEECKMTDQHGMVLIEAIKMPGQVPGGVDGLSLREGAAKQRPRWILEILVERICMEEPVILPPAVPDAYLGTSLSY
jgi:hypothetical protein